MWSYKPKFEQKAENNSAESKTHSRSISYRLGDTMHARRHRAKHDLKWRRSPNGFLSWAEHLGLCGWDSHQHVLFYNPLLGQENPISPNHSPMLSR